jgi:serine/threonine protein kinase
MGTKGYAAPECFISSAKEYEGIPSDIFSLGVVLFVLVMGFFPFEKPNCTDDKYKYIMKKDFIGFWKKCEKMLDVPISTFSSEFKNLFEKMVCYKANERLNINEIKNHPWFYELIGKNNNSNSNNKNDLNNSGNNSNTNLKANDILSDDNSNGDNNNIKKKFNKFNKSLKDTLNKMKNANEIIMNNKEDIKNESSSSKFFFFQPQISKYKELEMKCINELSNRKIEIDSILESEEDN